MRIRPLTLAITLHVGAGITGCSDLGEPYIFASDCDRSTGGVTFDDIALGDFQERRVKIANSGNADLVGEIELDDTHFQLAAGGGPFVIEPDTEIEVRFRFAPRDTGLHRAAVDLGDGCPPIHLAGLGVPPPDGPQCVVDPPALAFGSVKIDTVKDLAFEIRNPGLIRFAVDVALLGGGPFQILEGAGRDTLEVGDTLRVAVRFAPTVVDQYDASITASSACDVIPITANAMPLVTVSYAADIQPIWNSYCVVCHERFGNGNLDLRAINSYNQLVNVTSFSYAPAVRVLPFDVNNSVLIDKINFQGRFGGGMPQSAPMPVAERRKVETWVEEGALQN